VSATMIGMTATRVAPSTTLSQPFWAIEDIKAVERAGAGSGHRSPTDKVAGHTYQMMYGMLLIPLIRKSARVKMLEIGLGCDVGGGPGKSAALWRNLLPKSAELWMADTNEVCVRKHQAKLKQLDIRELVGDQGDRGTLTRWLAETGGNFDVVVDDGGHTSKQMLRTFEAFWPSLASGGLYFIEDISTIRHGNFDDTHGEAVMADVLQSWIEQLIVWEKWEWGARAWSTTGRHQLDCLGGSSACL